MTMTHNGSANPSRSIVPMDAIEQVLVAGDLAKLSVDQRVAYYNKVCDTVGLNPYTQPFEYLTLNGKMQLYAKKNCTDQLRQVHRVSVHIVKRESVSGVHVVTAKATLPDGREDESTGAVYIERVTGEALANALMKAETKAKRRVTLSICGLSMLDETEVESVPGARPEPKPPTVTVIKPVPEAPVPVLTGTVEPGEVSLSAAAKELIDAANKAATMDDLSAVANKANAAKKAGEVVGHEFDAVKATMHARRDALAEASK